MTTFEEDGDVCLRVPASRDAAIIDETLYSELLRRAQSLLAREPDGVPMEAGDLVQEAFLRITRRRAADTFNDRRHFLATAVIVMRHILVDHARPSSKRAVCVPLDLEVHALPAGESDPRSSAIHEALERLAFHHPRRYHVVGMRFFLGLELEEIAAKLGLSSRTVKRDLAKAHLWLRAQLTCSAAMQSRASAIPVRMAA